MTENSNSVGTTLEVLQAYLTAGIEIQVKTGWGGGIDVMTGTLVGLQTFGNEQVMLEMFNQGGIKKFTSDWKLADCLPLLYGFEALPHVLVETPWGKTPASVVIARMIANMQFMPENVKVERTSIWAQDYSGGPFKSVLFAETVERGYLMQPVVEWLRRHQFAVGLKPAQYIPKLAGGPTLEKEGTVAP